LRGKVDDWRIQRRCAYAVYCSNCTSTPINITEFQPLYFDDELDEKPDIEESMELYHKAVESGYFDDPK
jgi:hypothetical protein